MNKRFLRWLTIVGPVGFVVITLSIFLADMSLIEILVVLLLVSIGATFFSNWVFNVIDLREAEIQKRASQLEALNAAALSLITELDMGIVLQKVVDLSRELVKSKYGALGVLNDDGTEIEQFITSGLEPEERSRLGNAPEGRGIFRMLIQEGKSVIIDDIQGHDSHHGFPSEHPKMNSMLGVPIKTKGKIIGDLYLTEKIDLSDPDGKSTIGFTEEDRKILEMFATQAAIAIENARLYRQIQQLAILEERQRFGMDLHDGVIQSIYAVGLMLEDIQRRVDFDPRRAKEGITQAIQSLNTAISDIRNYILDLRPQHFQGRDIIQGVEELARALRANTFVDVAVNIKEVDPRRFSPERTVEILHIAQEALSNVQKHAKASEVEISMVTKDRELVLAIMDNGISIHPKSLESTNGNGLRNMRDRTNTLDGEIDIRPREEGGTEVILRVPVK